MLLTLMGHLLGDIIVLFGIHLTYLYTQTYDWTRNTLFVADREIQMMGIAFQRLYIYIYIYISKWNWIALLYVLIYSSYISNSSWLSFRCWVCSQSRLKLRPYIAESTSQAETSSCQSFSWESQLSWAFGAEPPHRRPRGRGAEAELAVRWNLE